MSKTLYVSDLDGTLLRGDQTLSRFTIETLGKLIEQGMIFSYATARSLITASKATAGLTPNIPVVIYNGSFVVESVTGERLLSNAFFKEDAEHILNVILQHQVYPIVYAFVDGEEKFSYCKAQESRGMKIFNDTRRGDIRDNPVDGVDDLYRGEIFHITGIDEPEKLLPLYDAFRDRYTCVYHQDIYSGEQWLEIQPCGATKAQAILALKKLLGCERIVCFGDGKNDISMFEIADECYAVENANVELKRIANATIGSNECDGVAKWLAEHYE